MSKNAEGWIRHNSKQQPVDDHVEVEIRTRGGDYEVCKASGFTWDATAENQIMAYRLHKPAEQVAPFIEAVQAFNALSKVPQLDGPLQWRDRITEIDATTQALTTKRAELVQRLASEGFALIGRINDLLTEAAQKHEDMSDWRNWKVGDFVGYAGENDSSFYIAGARYVIESISHDFLYLDDERGRGHKWTHCKEFKWHSRPSA